MERDGRTCSISLPELAVRATLADVHKPEPLEDSNHLPRLQNRPPREWL